MEKDSLLKDFLEHLFPKKVRKKDLDITYTLCMGGLCFVSFMILIVSGILLCFYYIPGKDAYKSIVIMESSVPFGIFLRSIHKYASDSLLIFLILHCLRVIFQGAYLPPRHKNWIIGCCLLVFCIFEAYLGCVLIQDRLGVWAFETGMKLFNYSVLTRFINKLFVVDGFNGQISLIRVYVFHILLLPIFIFILCLLHFYKIRKQKGILPYL